VTETYTPKQLEILRFIVDYRRKTGVSPTLAEIGNALGGVHRVTIHQHVRTLEKRGAIERGSGHHRNLLVVDPEINGETDKQDETLEMLKAHRGHEPIDIVGSEIDTSGKPHRFRLRCMQCGVDLLTADEKEAPVDA